MKTKDFDQAVRFAEALRESGLKGYQVEEIAGMSTGHLSRVLSGERREIRSTTMASYAAALGVEEAWLARGEGPKKTPTTAPPGTKLGEALGEAPPRVTSVPRFSSWAEARPLVSEKYAARGSGWASAGHATRQDIQRPRFS